MRTLQGSWLKWQRTNGKKQTNRAIGRSQLKMYNAKMARVCEKVAIGAKPSRGFRWGLEFTTRLTTGLPGFRLNTFLKTSFPALQL